MSQSAFNQAALSPTLMDLGRLKPFWPQAPGIDIGALARSISRDGLLRPLLAFENDGCLSLLAGAKRRAALLSLGLAEAPVLMMPPGLARTALLAAGLADNGDRAYNPAETALIWNFLSDNESDSAGELSAYLGLRESPKLRAWCRAAAALPDYALKALADGGLDLELAARLASWEDDSRKAVLDLFEALAPSKQKKKQWLDWLEDLSRLQKISPALILADDALRLILSQAPERGKPAAEGAARQLIWARRYPLLSELMRRREAKVKALALPPELRLELDPSLEDLKYTFTLAFTSLEEFRQLLGRLDGLKDRPEFASLLDDSQEQIPAGEIADAGR